MKKFKRYIIFTLFLIPFFAVNAQNKVKTDTVTDYWGKQYVFIRHDSIPLFSTDSITDFNENKIATKNFREAEQYYYALTPSYQLSVRHYQGKDFVAQLKKGGSVAFFQFGEGIIRQGINYITEIDGKEIVINTHEKFCRIFAPVETIQEAIAFAYILTDSKPMYNLDYLVEPPVVTKPWIPEFDIDPVTQDTIWEIKPYHPAKEPEWVIYTPEIISSYAKHTEDGYELLLYHYKFFGCTHPYIRRLIKVTFDGMIEILEEQKAFERCDMIGFCID